MLLRGSAVSAAVLMVFVAGALGAMALRSRVTQDSKTRAPQATQVVAVASAPDATPAAPPIEQQGDLAPRAHSPVVPVLREGETTLSDGVTATRSDTVVTLSFDTPLTRTRIPDKFERFVRATLPQIYGAVADSALARVPNGGIAGQGDLLYDLPTRGVHIPLDNRWTIALFPETRPGQDGPLVIRYRVSVVSPN